MKCMDVAGIPGGYCVNPRVGGCHWYIDIPILFCTADHDQLNFETFLHVSLGTKNGKTRPYPRLATFHAEPLSLSLYQMI